MVADLSTRETFTTEEVATNRCNSLAWIPGSFLALSTHDDGAVRVWNCESRVDVPQPQSHKGPISALVSHPDRALVVSAGRDHTLRTWDTTGTPRICLGPYTADVMELALDRKRDEACVFFENGPLLIYNMQSGEEVDGLDLELCGDIRAATVREGEQLAITGVANRQGQDPVEGLILQMDLESLDELAVWRAHQERIWALAAHPNGRWLLSASEDGSAKAWDLETLSCRQSVEINEPITAMAVHQDGQFVLLAGMSIWLWHLGSGHCVRSAVRHQEQVRSIALHPAGKIGASVGLDRTLLLWELDPLRCVGRWDADTQLVACVFSLDGVLVTGGASGELAFFRLVGFPGGPQ